VRISVFASDELQAILIALRSFDADLRRQIRASTKSVTQAEWQQEVGSRATSASEQAVLAKTARVKVTDQNITLSSATIGRSLAGGAKPSELYGGKEFGGDPEKEKGYASTSKKGRAYRTKRHTQRQLRPFKKTGYVVYPAAAEIIPRIASLWWQTTVRAFHEAIEKG
jgi:hypothetical protein